MGQNSPDRVEFTPNPQKNRSEPSWAFVGPKIDFSNRVFRSFNPPRTRFNTIFPLEKSSWVWTISLWIAAGVGWRAAAHEARGDDARRQAPHITADCIWSVIPSQSPISISIVSFQQNVAKET